jgi:hypothetical protein
MRARKVGALIDASGNGAGILAQDGAYSIAVGSSSLWLFGDTFYGDKEIAGGTSNSAAWSRDPNASDGLSLKAVLAPDGKPAPALEHDPAERQASIRLWPGHGIFLAGRTYLYYSIVRPGKEGPLDLAHLGQGLARWKEPAGPFERLRDSGRREFWSAREPALGLAVLDGRDGFLYIYGRAQRPPYGLFLARVRPAKIERRSAYEYASIRDGKTRWRSTLESALPLFEDAPPEASVSYNPFLRRYLMLYARFLEQDVVVRTAGEPWGPWTAPSRIYECPRSVHPPQGTSCYAAKEHPQFVGPGGETVYFSLVDGRVFGGRPELFELKLTPSIK